MKLLIKILFSVFIITIVFFSCKKPEVYSDIPVISFKSITVKDTTNLLDGNVRRVSIVFSIIDGDGDIGLNDYDTLYPYNSESLYYNNLFIKLFEKKDGVFQEVTDLKNPYFYRTPYVDNSGQNKTLKADIQVDIDYPILKYDTVYYEIYIYDRALNLSNTIKTSEIKIKN